MKTLIKNGYVITVDQDFTIYQHGAVCYENDKIVEVGETSKLEAKYQDAKIIDATDKIIMPGLINTHLHSGLIRGTAEDMPVFEWLAKHVDPTHRVVLPDDAYIASKLCYTEALLSGTTTVVDMYRHMNRCADAANETGIRAILAPYIADRNQYNYFETVETNEKLFLERHGDADGRIHVWFGIEHMVYTSKESFIRIGKLAEKYDTGIHVHGEESIQMATMIRQKYGCSPIQEFYNRGIMGPKTLVAHCCWITPSEIEIFKKTGASIAHCPVSNMKLASGVCPVPAALDREISVGIGSDGVKENNNIDMLEEMKFTGLIQKLSRLDAQAMPAKDIIRMATIVGAKAIGLDNQIGSLEAGKKADIITVNLRSLHMSPVLYGQYENIIPNLVYSANGADVDMTIVNGQVRVKNHIPLNVNTDELIDKYTQVTKDLIIRREPFIPRDISMNKLDV